MMTMKRYTAASALLCLLAACGGGGGGSSPTPATPIVSAPNTVPTISSSSSVNVSENALGVIYTLSASDSDGTVARLEMLSNGDSSLFSFNGSNGELSLGNRLRFDAPSDSDADNVYDLEFEVEDNDGAITSFQLAITVEEAMLKAGLPPSGNFELIDWKLDLPVDDNGNFSGASGTVSENTLANGYESAYFFTGPDGGIVMRAPVIGATTPNSSFTRTELREMLRRGNTSISTRGAGNAPNGNNWALSSQPATAQTNAGGVDGTLRVTLAVNIVTTTGTNSHVGRMIIGQIHAKSDEPIRLYYRKLPGNSRGSVYAIHEISGGADVRYEIVGDSSNSASNPSNGFMLDEKFTYEIIAIGNLLTVDVFDEVGALIGTTDIDMSASGYDVADDFMYFKAGLYHVNNSADTNEVAQVTLYELTNTHSGYPF